MRRIYHLVPKLAWEHAAPGPYRACSLATEGFIHCSNADQVAASANRYYAEENDLLMLCLDVGRITSPVLDEPARGGELFPHVYGPIDREAIVEVRKMARGPESRWMFPEIR